MSAVLERCRDRLREIVAAHGLSDIHLEILAKPLTPEEAIGTPGRRDFPILIGKERVIEATALGARGQAFTDSPAEFVGQLREVLDLPLDSNRRRALFVAALNAVLRHLGMADGTVHCRDDDPERCGAEIAAHARRAGARAVGLVGLNPAIAEALAKEFGSESVRITDLNPDNIGARKFGIKVLDGRTGAEEMIRASDLVIVTGTTLVNGTFDGLWAIAQREGKPAILYGITAAGVCRLMEIPRICPCARDGENQ